MTDENPLSKLGGDNPNPDQPKAEGTNPPVNEQGRTQHTEKVEEASKDTKRSGPSGNANPDASRTSLNPNDYVKDLEARKDIEKRGKLTADDLPTMTGAQMDEELGTTFANADKDGARIISQPIGGVVVGMNNKDIVDPTADNRSRYDDLGPVRPIHKYGPDSTERPEDRDQFLGSRPETS